MRMGSHGADGVNLPFRPEAMGCAVSCTFAAQFDVARLQGSKFKGESEKIDAAVEMARGFLGRFVFAIFAPAWTS